MREIYLIRHGKPELAGGEKRCIGWTDVPLSGEGRRAMEALGLDFKDKDIEKIYTSPLKRCVESARALSGGRIPIEVLEELREVYMGEWENLSFCRIREKYPKEYEARGRDMAVFAPPGGESFKDCQDRALRALERVRAESRGNVIIMAHAGLNRCLISHLEGRRLGGLFGISQEYGEVYCFSEPVFDAVIAAAGMSSRMGEFKPLMELGGKTVIGRQLETLRRGGAREIAVVTGNRAEEIRAAAAGPGVTFLHNENYETTKMFDSVCLGLRYFEQKARTPEGRTLDGIFFLPVDVPLFTEFTMEYEAFKFKGGDGDVYCPCFDGAPGHPLLIRASAIPALLSHDGERGLKGAYERLGERTVRLSVPDCGAVMDMDTAEDFARLADYERSRPVADEAMALRLLKWFKTDEAVVRHCQAVAGLAQEIAACLNRRGAGLDMELVRSGALLHDVARAWPEHEKTGAKWLSMLGHTRTAQVVRDHMDLPPEKAGVLCESLAVYLADKMIQEEKRVSVKQRFDEKRKRFKGRPEALLALEKRYAIAERALLTAERGGYIYEAD